VKPRPPPQQHHCCVCGKPRPVYELQEFGWDIGVAPDGAFLHSCSKECRAKAGLPERYRA
jgi:hypothetical protein